MTEINNLPPVEITACTTFTFTIKLDSTKFSPYTRQGIVENIKVPKKVSYNSWADSFKNPLASTQYGMFETPDLSKFGRSDQLHYALYGVLNFMKANNKFPENNEGDIKSCQELAAKMQTDNKAANAEFFGVEEIDAKVFENAVKYAGCSISPMAAFFGGIVA